DSFRKLAATCQEQPALLHFEVVLNHRRVHRDLSGPAAFLATAETFGDGIARSEKHGASPPAPTIARPMRPMQKRERSCDVWQTDGVWRRGRPEGSSRRD